MACAAAFLLLLPLAASGVGDQTFVAETTASTAAPTQLSGLSSETSRPVTVPVGDPAREAAAPSTQSTPFAGDVGPMALPDPPPVVAARAPAGAYAFVNWQAPAVPAVGAASYHLWRSADGVAFSAVATISGPSADTYSYVDTGLRSSTRYWYAVSTIDDRGESSMSTTDSAAWSWTAPVTGPPARPTDVHALEGSATVVLGWQGVPNPAVKGYVILRRNRSLDSAITTLAETTDLSTTWIDDTVANGSEYWYSVRAIDESETIGFPSLEKHASPHAAYAGVNPHVVSADSTGNSCKACHGGNEYATPDRTVIHAVPPNSLMLWPISGPNEDMMCLRCHHANSGRASTDTSSQIGFQANRSAMPLWTSMETTATLTCGDCHAAVSPEIAPVPGLMAAGGTGMAGVGAVRGDEVCYSCHGPASTLEFGDISGFEDSAHAQVPGPPSGSNVKCVACHRVPSSRNTRLTRYEGYMVCMQCHTSADSDPNLPDLWTRLTLGEPSDSRHPMLPDDQTSGQAMECQNCHNSHSATMAFPNVDPHDPTPAGQWTTPRSDQKAFCFRCHDGEELPTSAEAAPWTSPVLAADAATSVADIRLAYQTNFHGSGVTSDPVLTQSHLRPDMGYSAGTILECWSCHDAHGSINQYTLSQNVVSASGDATVTGTLVYSNEPTSTGGPGGSDLRFFCAGCHLFDAVTRTAHDSVAETNTAAFPVNCTTCHRHIRSAEQSAAL